MSSRPARATVQHLSLKTRPQLVTCLPHHHEALSYSQNPCEKSQLWLCLAIGYVPAVHMYKSQLWLWLCLLVTCLLCMCIKVRYGCGWLLVIYMLCTCMKARYGCGWLLVMCLLCTHIKANYGCGWLLVTCLLCTGMTQVPSPESMYKMEPWAPVISAMRSWRQLGQPSLLGELQAS